MARSDPCRFTSKPDHYATALAIISILVKEYNSAVARIGLLVESGSGTQIASSAVDYGRLGPPGRGSIRNCARQARLKTSWTVRKSLLTTGPAEPELAD